MADKWEKSEKGHSKRPYSILSRERLRGKWQFIVLIVFFLVLVEEGSALAKYGMWGFFIAIVALVLVRIVTNWSGYIQSLRDVETRIFGRPLEKRYWKEGEWENTKIKFKWKKN